MGVRNLRKFYSETTWAVGIAQWTHQKVAAPQSEWGVNCAIPTPMSVYFVPHSICVIIWIFFKSDSSGKEQKNIFISEMDSVHSTQLAVMVWPQRLFATSQWCPSQRSRAKHDGHFTLENCTQTTRVYWSKNPIGLLYIYIGWNYLRLKKRAIFSRRFPNVRCLLYQSVPHRLRYYHCVSASPII